MVQENGASTPSLLASRSRNKETDGIDDNNGVTECQRTATNLSPSVARAPACADKNTPSVWQEIVSTARFITGGLHYPVENLMYVISTVSQISSKLLGRRVFTPESDIGDLSGKVILVTGGNSGLGKQTALQLAKHYPSRIYLGARTESKALTAIEDIKSSLTTEQISTTDIRYLPLDLSSFQSIRNAASIFRSENNRLDILMLNAGVMAVPPGTTEDGYEIQFGTNFLGHFLLTKLLLPILIQTAKAPGTPQQPTADVRVISVSSLAWQLAPAHNPLEVMTSTRKLLSENTWTRYGCSKAGNVVLAAQLAHLYPQITSVSLHPGLIMTNLYSATKSSNPLVKYATALASPLLASEEEGALNHLWAIGVEKEMLVNGAYYEPVGVWARNWFAEDETLGEELWR
ncbi:short-chain dehydrogenase/reductase, partial [Histoplasma capsulatum]